MAYADKKKMYDNNNRLNRDNYDRISLMVKKGRRELIREAAAKTGESVNSFIVRLIDDELERLSIEREHSTGDDCSIYTPLDDSSNV